MFHPLYPDAGIPAEQIVLVEFCSSKKLARLSLVFEQEHSVFEFKIDWGYWIKTKGIYFRPNVYPKESDRSDHVRHHLFGFDGLLLFFPGTSDQVIRDVLKVIFSLFGFSRKRCIATLDDFMLNVEYIRGMRCSWSPALWQPGKSQDETFHPDKPCNLFMQHLFGQTALFLFVNSMMHHSSSSETLCWAPYEEAMNRSRPANSKNWHTCQTLHDPIRVITKCAPRASRCIYAVPDGDSKNAATTGSASNRQSADTPRTETRALR